MQVMCGKCSRPIAVTDVIQPTAGTLTHLDCARAHGLTPEERRLLFVYCSDHPVAKCLSCGLLYRMVELAADPLGARTNLCPRCRGDLTESARAHLYSCVVLPSELRLRTQQVRDAAQLLIKRSQQTIDRSDVMIREAEVHLLERQQALRAMMARVNRS